MAKKNITIPIFIPHLGCPHRCYFCNQKQTSGSGSIPDKAYIQKKIRKYLSNIPSTVERIEIAFFGGSFTGMSEKKQEKLLSAAYPYVKKKIIHGIRLSTRPDYVSEDCLNLLKQFEVTTIELGVQSFSDDVLAGANRGHKSEDSDHAIELIKKSGLNLVIQLMPGLPGDTFEKSIISARLAANHSPDAVRVYPTIVLKKTELATMYYKNLYKPLTFDTAIDTCKEIYLIFAEKGIPVIRMGLHPFIPEEEKNIIAGPYHPSFGFLVKSRIKRDIMEKKIIHLIRDNVLPDKVLKIIIPGKEKEEYIGNKKENIYYLKNKFNINNIEYIIRNIPNLKLEVGSMTG